MLTSKFTSSVLVMPGGGDGWQDAAVLPGLGINPDGLCLQPLLKQNANWRLAQCYLWIVCSGFDLFDSRFPLDLIF